MWLTGPTETHKQNHPEYSLHFFLYIHGCCIPAMHGVRGKGGAHTHVAERKASCIYTSCQWSCLGGGGMTSPGNSSMHRISGQRILRSAVQVQAPNLHWRVASHHVWGGGGAWHHLATHLCTEFLASALQAQAPNLHRRVASRHVLGSMTSSGNSSMTSHTAL